MLPELELTESDELGYYIKFKDLFTEFIPFCKKNKDDYIAINFSFTDEDIEPSEIQLKTHKILMSCANQMMDGIIKYLKQDEEYLTEFYGVYNVIEHEFSYSDERTHNYVSKEGFPLVEEATEIINYFTIDAINICDSEEDSIAFIGFLGSCSWDTEHGFGAAFHGSKLLHVNDWEFGKYPSWASSKDKDEDEYFLTEYFTKFHLLENLGERKSRLAQLGQFVKIENTVPYLEIFDWLVDHKMIYGYRNKPSDLTTEEVIVLLNEIKELNFYGNHIDVFPDGIDLLENLKSLHLSFNLLQNFPLQVTKLIGLEKLAIVNNKIEYVPVEISSLINLKCLKLSSNKLESIPEAIGLLTNLRSLDLGTNKLKDLPKTFSNFEYLEELDLSYNKFESLPNCIFDIQSLKDLDVSSNKIEKLPESFFLELPKLSVLHISINRMSLQYLEHLKVLMSEKINSDIDKAIFCVIDNLERREEEESSTQYKNKSSKLETSDTNRKWWEFWK